jgi:hypothetical protein
MTNCNICQSNTFEKFQRNILNKYNIKYYQCERCEFIQTEKPYWLDEAYSSAITFQDIGLLYRNNLYTPIVSILIKLYFDRFKKFLDYGGGYGVFTRLMRDKGFNFFRFDTYCENYFARTFDDDSKTQYELVTSFEVFEHLVDPLNEIEKMLKKGRNIFFSTELQPESDIENWWYIMPETGQHISLYTLKSLEFIANKYNLNLYSNGSTFHLLTDKKISKLIFKVITKFRVASFLSLIFKNSESFLMSDYNKVKK